MMRRLDNFWYRLLYTAHCWILSRVAAHCQRDRVRRVAAHCRQETLRRLERQLEWQRNHLN